MGQYNIMAVAFPTHTEGLIGLGGTGATYTHPACISAGDQIIAIIQVNNNSCLCSTCCVFTRFDPTGCNSSPSIWRRIATSSECCVCYSFTWGASKGVGHIIRVTGAICVAPEIFTSWCHECCSTTTPDPVISPSFICSGDHGILTIIGDNTGNSTEDTPTVPCGYTLIESASVPGLGQDVALATARKILSDGTCDNPGAWTTNNNISWHHGTLLFVEDLCGCGKNGATLTNVTFSGAGCVCCSTTFSVTTPTELKKRDLLVVAITRCAAAGAITCVPDCLTLFRSADASVSLNDLDLYYKKADGCEPACLTFTSATSDSWVGAAWRIRKGCFCVAPTVSSASEVCESTTHAQPQASGVISDWLAISVFATGEDHCTVTICSDYTDDGSVLKTCVPVMRLDVSSRTFPYARANITPGDITVGTDAADSHSVTFLVHTKTQKVKNKPTNKSCTCVTSLALTIPSDVCCCDLLFIMIQRCCLAGGLTWPSGWTSFFSEDTANGDLDLGWHVATAAEACSTVTVCFCTSDIATGQMFHMTNSFICCAPIVSCSATIGTSTTPNPPSLTTGTARSYLAVTFVGGKGTITDPACGYPACHTAGNTVFSTGGCDFWSLSSFSTCAFCCTTSNPGTYTINTSQDWTAVTLFVRPCVCALTFVGGNVSFWGGVI